MIKKMADKKKKKPYRVYSPGGKLGTHAEASKFMEDFYKKKKKRK